MRPVSSSTVPLIKLFLYRSKWWIIVPRLNTGNVHFSFGGANFSARNMESLHPPHELFYFGDKFALLFFGGMLYRRFSRNGHLWGRYDNDVSASCLNISWGFTILPLHKRCAGIPIILGQVKRYFNLIPLICYTNVCYKSQTITSSWGKELVD